jgi:hypothetical protein
MTFFENRTYSVVVVAAMPQGMIDKPKPLQSSFDTGVLEHRVSDNGSHAIEGNNNKNPYRYYSTSRNIYLFSLLLDTTWKEFIISMAVNNIMIQ